MDIMLLLGAVVAGGALALLISRGTKRAGVDPGVAAEIQRLGERVAAESSALAVRLEGIDHRLTHTQAASTDLAKSIFDALGDVRRATVTVADQAREFSSLQDLLRAPKARGGLGEAMLVELLRQVLPPKGFTSQHRFSSGTIVDAVVRAGDKLVCIDSKFPLSNYKRMCDAGDEVERAEAERAFAADVERHIHAIATRYVVPDEGTLDFAVMYVPAEGVYAEVLRLAHRKKPLFEMALEARVVPMSPLTLYGYLQTILMGLNCLQIEQNAQRILDYCGRLHQEMERFAGEYEVLGRHLTNARSKYEEGSHRLERFRNKLDRVVDLGEDPAERPSLEVVGE